MNPITRATIKSFCRICLESIEGKESDCKNIEDDGNLAKWTQKIIPISMQSLYSATEADNDSKTKLICNICFVKISTFYDFHERSTCCAKALKLLLEEDQNSLLEEQLKKLKSFCRTCLRRQKDATKIQKVCDVKEWLLKFKLFMYNDDEQLLPEIICKICYKKLRGLNTFQQQAKQSFEYLRDVLGTEDIDEVLNARTDDANSETLQDCSRPEVKGEVVESIFVEEANYSNVVLEEPIEALNSESAILPNDTALSEHLPNFEANSFIDSYFIKEEEEEEEEEKQMETFPTIEQFEQVSEEQDDVSDELPSTDSEEMAALPVKTAPASNKKIKGAQRIKGKRKLSATAESNSSSDTESLQNPESELSTIEASAKWHKERKTRETYKCDQCEKKFYKKARYEDHMEIVHKGSTNIRQCSMCSNTFRSIDSLERHIKALHDPLVIKNFTCSYCCHSFSEKDKLQAHVRMVHLKERPFKCKTCGKAFGAANALRRHEMTHTSDYPFVCEICDWSFRQRTQLNLHMKSHTADPALMCPVCKRVKSSLEELEVHKEQFHIKKQCFKCGKTFNNAAHLREHDKAVHLKLRPYKCSMCEKSFARSYDCQEHEHTHSKERSQICDICQKGFSNRSSLRKHKSKHLKSIKTGKIKEEREEGEDLNAEKNYIQ